MTHEEFMRLIEEIRESPGEKILNEIEKMQSSLHLLKRNKDELVKMIDRLTRDEVVLQMWDIEKRELLFASIEEVARYMHNFLSAAFSLVDHMRRHRRRFYANTGFEEEIDREVESRFAGDNDHMIAQGLRNIALHYQVLPPTAELRYDRAIGISSAYVLPTHELRKWSDWNAEELQAIRSMGDSLDMRQFAERYFLKIEEFYAWLWERQAKLHRSEIDTTNELRKRARALYGMTS